MNAAKLIRDLMKKGLTQALIGHHIGISQGAVSLHLKADGKSELSHSKGERLMALHRRICGATRAHIFTAEGDDSHA